MSERLRRLAERWADAPAAERANAQVYLIELCEALEVERPGPSGSGYQFELPIRAVYPDGTESTNFVDLYKQDCFLLEAKDQEAGHSTEMLLRKAFGQARSYVSHLPGLIPPYLMVLDVGRTLIVWDRWLGSYGGFNAGRTIDLTDLANRPEHVALLRDIWQNPQARNPLRKAEAVTREVAERLAELAASLEERGLPHERVARFLIRVVFTLFAEDIGLLPEEPFRRSIEQVGFQDPDRFPEALRLLWEAMDQGGAFGYHKLLRFNGRFFEDCDVPPLTSANLRILHSAATSDWRDVEPAIFGTLMVRALDPVERHRLGAEFTPRAYVERLVRPTIEEPIRRRWTLVQAQVLQLRERIESAKGRKRQELTKQALDHLHQFHTWLRSLRVLDPACGSGNFLYVALDTMKRVELEVFREIEQVTGQHESRVEEINPSQFHGIEVNPWARELAELTLWIGYHQWWKRTHGAARPPEPVLVDTGTFELRDAVLAWDEIVEDPERARPDPTPRIPHPVTGELVPDPEAKLPYMAYRGARQAPWPEADFIVGNPPYMGLPRQRHAFGDGYVDAIRSVYPDVPQTVDYVMYWWARAAEEVAAGRTTAAGLITTNTITQSQNRQVVADAAARGARVTWTIPDHPWVDETGNAAVRVALTITSAGVPGARLIKVDDSGRVVSEASVHELNSDLTVHADVPRASLEALSANRGLCSPGFKLHGPGFILKPDEAEALHTSDPVNSDVIRPYLNGRDVASRPRGVFVIDFGVRSEEAARAFPMLFDIVRDRVKPGRMANNDRATRENWWRFGRNREEFRPALEDLARYVVTVETSKHRYFTFLDRRTAADNMLICIALDDGFSLGVLSSRIHIVWTLAAGGRLGVGNDPRYNKTKCFDPFPFPNSTIALRSHVADVAERLDAHRKAALDRDERVTMTGMYNVVEKLRLGEALTDKERAIHEVAACGVLKDIHDELDALVAEAYGWPWPLTDEEILERLVRLHDERVEEEKRGHIRWLRPDYQIPRFAPEGAALELEADEEEARAVKPTERVAWPDDVIDQLAALRDAVAAEPLTAEELAAQFRGARRDAVLRHLEMLTLLGELTQGEDGRYRRVAEPSVAGAA